MAQMNETNVGVPEAGDNDSPPKPEKYTVILVDDTHDHQEIVKRIQEAAAGLESVMAPVCDVPLLSDEGEHYHLPEGCSREEYQEQMKNPEVAQAVEEAIKSVEEHVPQGLPHFQRKKLHPHKRAISSDNRRALTAGGNAFWLKGKK
jgi:hypothetical protein